MRENVPLPPQPMPARPAAPASSLGQAQFSSPYDVALLLLSRDGDLHQAEAAAQRAARLAPSREEQYKVVFLLAQIECKLGHHQAELEQAQKLLALKPQNTSALLACWRAAQCNGLGPLERQMRNAMRSRGYVREAP